jgi:asparagine synthase (glutamine-hydrolysing)
MRGAPAEFVARAVAAGDALPGARGDSATGVRGFAGKLPDGRLVRDVLGRQPVFVDSEVDGDWSFSPDDLDEPESVPAGHVLDFDRTRSGTESDTGPEPERVFSLPAPEIVQSNREAVTDLRNALRGSLDSLGVGTASEQAVDDLAVAFSGGVDSAVVASALDAPLYVVGFPGSHDVDAAREAARLMGREDDLRVVELEASTLERAVPKVARATGRTNAMDVQIALPLFLAGERAAADGFDWLAVGQGADELFGGYAKVARATEDPRVEAETVRGAVREVVATLPDQLERDVLALRTAGVEPVAPLLDDRLIDAALRLTGDLLVD